MPRFLAIVLALVAQLAFAAKPAIDQRLVGSWGQMGQPFFRFDADGTGETPDGAFHWAADGANLELQSEGETLAAQYVLDGGRVIVVMGGVPLQLERIGAAPDAGAGRKAPSAKNSGAVAAIGGRDGKPGASGGKPGAKKAASEPQADAVSRLLISSAWCSFSYNKVSGASHTRRVQFFADGTWSDNSRGEGYSSGYGGTVASQHDAKSGGQWQIRDGKLWLSGPDFPLMPVDTRLKQNSNGYPIVVADGVEYSQCQ